MYQKYYQDFLKGHQGKLHFAAHSHHFWPDVTKEAILQTYLDASRLSDEKWSHFFSEILPLTQKLISQIIQFSRPQDIAFASNTHELLSRVLSCFLEQKTIRILTTNCEFHSFKRQLDRLMELPSVHVDIVEVKEDFEDQLIHLARENDYDLIFISHVFFNNGRVFQQEKLEEFVSHKKEALFILDGYHSYCALDVDISSLEDTIFFLGGSYKYAQGGEGLCFMTLPKNCKLRPVYTGWFADFEGLTSSSDTVNYTDNGFRFMGATLDITAFYRFNAVWSHFFSEGLSVSTFDQYIKTLMKKFIQLIGEDQFYLADLSKIGHFLTLKCQSQDEASTLFHQLKDKGVLTDYRNASLRFGFGPYLTQKDVEKACAILTSLRKS